MDDDPSRRRPDHRSSKSARLFAIESYAPDPGWTNGWSGEARSGASERGRCTPDGPRCGGSGLAGEDMYCACPGINVADTRGSGCVPSQARAPDPGSCLKYAKGLSRSTATAPRPAERPSRGPVPISPVAIRARPDLDWSTHSRATAGMGRRHARPHSPNHRQRAAQPRASPSSPSCCCAGPQVRSLTCSNEVLTQAQLVT